MALHAVVLAGGTGQRFWPLSRELSPKQLLTVFGTESLVAQAVHRVIGPVEEAGGTATIVTNERLLDELRNNLSSNDDERLGSLRYLVEPLGRNTGPAIALAAAALLASDPDAVMVVLPSDHLLADGPLWQEVLHTGVALASGGFLVTVGIQPTRAETGFGYIEAGEVLGEYASSALSPARVDRFIEKPDAATARSLYESGRYLWNAGVFVMKAAQVLAELKVSGGDPALIASVCEHVVEHPVAEWTGDHVRDAFAVLPSVSIDTALMERSPNVAVIPAALDWQDVGSFLALESLGERDERGNVRVGRGVDLDSDSSIVYSADRLVATLGLKDTVIVDTADATLVCARDRCQDVKSVVEALKALQCDEVILPKTSLRPWGSWTSLMRGPGFQIKLLEIKPGRKPSLQRHEHRSEHWVVVEGEATVTRDTDSIEVRENESVFIPKGAVHRVENRGDRWLKIIEVQVGDYLGEDDIVRLEDDWHREEVR